MEACPGWCGKVDAGGNWFVCWDYVAGQAKQARRGREREAEDEPQAAWGGRGIRYRYLECLRHQQHAGAVAEGTCCWRGQPVLTGCLVPACLVCAPHTQVPVHGSYLLVSPKLTTSL